MAVPSKHALKELPSSQIPCPGKKEQNLSMKKI